MYGNVVPAAAGGTAVIGLQIGAAQSPVPAVAGVARATLPFTGFAFALYLAFALALVVIGAILTAVARRQTSGGCRTKAQPSQPS